MKKNGFTLVELMVIIVIIGALAAIAIPKLFGMDAKAKFMRGTYSEVQRVICLDYFNENKSSKKFLEQINKRNYNCKDYLQSREDEAVVTETPSTKSTSEMFMSGNITDDERDQCITHMNNSMNDNDLYNAFQIRVRNGLTCETMMTARKEKVNNASNTNRYKIMNDETVIFYSNDAAQLAADMAEVKDKMTKKNIKSSIQTSTGTVVTYGF